MKQAKISLKLRSISIALAIWQGVTAIIPLSVIALTLQSENCVAVANQDSTPAKQTPAVIHKATIHLARTVLPDFSASPTDSELFSVHIFPVALLPVGHSTSNENKALVNALEAYVQRTNLEDQSILTDFLQQNPDSVWKPALLVNLGILWRQAGYFSNAMEAWQESWDLTKNAKDFRTKSLADRAVGELAQIESWVGRYESLNPLMAELGDRKLIGGAEEMLASARDGLWVLNHKPGSGFLCGPFALEQIMDQGNTNKVATPILNARSSTNGFSLSQLQGLADESGLNYQMARREPGSPIILNSVIHWKLNHYGALLKEDHGRYLVRDTTFSHFYGQNLWISKSAIDEESDGYFLVPQGPLPQGWHQVDSEEGQNIWGKGITYGRKTTALTTNDVKLPCPPKKATAEKNHAMAGYNVFMMLVSLNVSDTPIWYQPPVGPGMSFTVTYNQRETYSEAEPNYSNLGAQWTFDWQTYVADNGKTGSRDSVTRFSSGGGELEYDMADESTGLYSIDRDGNTLVYDSTNDTYALEFADGSKQVYGYASSLTGPRNMFLTAIYDKAGNAMTFSYDGSGRIDHVSDALGQSTSFFYDLNYDQYKITRIEDPFGRFAYFQYDQNERLHEIIDMIGIHSAFDYDSADFINTLRTPYGATSFSYTDGGATGARSLLVTDPLGNQQYVYSPNTMTSSGIYGSETYVPQGASFANGDLDYRDTFYFDKIAMSTVGSSDLENATIYHWLHDNETTDPSDPFTSDILESMREPLESRIWYCYPGQAAAGFSAGITLRQPSVIARVVDNPNNSGSPSTQLYQISYSKNGRVTQVIDPKGRTTDLDYYENGQDLQDVKQITATGFDYIGRYGTYNTQHCPASYTDTAGESYAYTWKANGQLSQVTDPESHTVRLNYNTDSYLTNVVESGGVLSATNSFGYDALGRMDTVTNASGYYEDYTYDNLDRTTQVSFPDGTDEKYYYSKLDLFTVYDRVGNRSVYTYDALDHMVSATDAQNRITQFTYCGCGELESITDPSLKTTSWQHDLEGRTTEKLYADDTSIQYTYGPFGGELQTATDARSQVKTFSYDVDDVLTNLVYSNCQIPTPSVSYAYDAYYPRLVSMNDGTGQTTFSYNAVPGTPSPGAGRLQSQNASYLSSSVSYQYDDLGRLTVRAVDSIAEKYQYDNISRLYAITNVLGGFTNTYADAGNRISYVTGPFLQAALTYFDNSGDQRLQNLSYGYKQSSSFMYGLYGLNYDYDKLGRLDGKVVKKGVGSVDQVQTQTYTYDNASQLLGADYSLGPNLVLTAYPSMTFEASSGQSDMWSGNPYSYGYHYDGSGNRTSSQYAVSGGGPTQVKSYGYNNVNEIYNVAGIPVGTILPITIKGVLSEPASVQVNGQAANVISNGLLNAWVFQSSINTTNGTNSAVTNSFNVIATASGTNGSLSTTNSFTANMKFIANDIYNYDANGNTISVQRGGTNSYYVWDGENRLVAITNGSDVSQFTYDGASRCVRIVELNGSTISSDKRFVWDGDNRLQERNSSGAVTKRFFSEGEQISGANYYYVKDDLGSIREMVDGAATVHAIYDYDAYGNQTKLCGDVDSDFAYAGYYRHAPSDLYLTIYRAYDPTIGRWINRDPIEEAGGINLYDYAMNNPINFADPLGLWTFTIYGGDGFAGYLSFGYNQGHFSLFGGAGAGAGINISFDPKNSTDGNSGGTWEGGLRADVDVGNGPVGGGLEAKVGATNNKCGGKSFAKVGINGTFAVLSGSVGFGGERESDEDNWHSVYEPPDWQFNLPSPLDKDGRDVWSGNWAPKERVSRGGFVGPYIGYTW